MKHRKPKADDQQKAHKAHKLLQDFVIQSQKESNIESALFMGPMICVLAEVYKESNVPFNFFANELLEAAKHYWDQ